MSDECLSVREVLASRVEPWMDVLFVGLSPELLAEGSLPRLTTVRQGGSVPLEPWDAAFFRYDARSQPGLREAIDRAREGLRRGGTLALVALPPAPAPDVLCALLADAESPPQVLTPRDGSMIALELRAAPGRHDLVGLRRNLRVLLDRVSALESLISNGRDTDSTKKIAGPWSFKELVGHLGDLDRFGYLVRLKALLDGQPDAPAPDWNAEVMRHDHQGRQLSELVVRFRHFRYQSIEFLESLQEEQWLTQNGDHQSPADLVRTWAREEAHWFSELERHLG